MPKPKDWTAHKAELETLYLKDWKTLQSIRKTMKVRGFDASTRSYRMKFEEWNLRKNKYPTVKKRKRQDSLVRPVNVLLPTDDDLPQPSQAEPIDQVSLVDHLSVEDGSNSSIHWKAATTIPRRTMDPEEIINLVPQPGSRVLALLCKWQEGSNFLPTLKELLRDKATTDEMYTLGFFHTSVSAEFHAFVKPSLPGVQRREITRTIYAAILHHATPPLDPFSSWASSRNFLLAHDWVRAVHGLTSGERDEDYWNGAIVAMTEWLLSHLDLSSQDGVPCSTCNVLSQQQRERQYVEVLIDLEGWSSRPKDLCVSQKFYRRALEIALSSKEPLVEDERSLQQREIERLLAKMEDYRRQISSQNRSAEEARVRHQGEIDHLNAKIANSLNHPQLTQEPPTVISISNSRSASGTSSLRTDECTDLSDLIPNNSSRTHQLLPLNPQMQEPKLCDKTSVSSNIANDLPPPQYLHWGQEAAFDTIYLAWLSGGTPGPRTTFIEAIYGSKCFEFFVRWVGSRINSRGLEFLRAVVKEYIHISNRGGVASSLRLHDITLIQVPQWSRIRDLLRIEDAQSILRPPNSSVVLYPDSPICCFAEIWVASAAKLHHFPAYSIWKNDIYTMGKKMCDDIARLNVQLNRETVKTLTEVLHFSSGGLSTLDHQLQDSLRKLVQKIVSSGLPPWLEMLGLPEQQPLSDS